MIDMSSVQTLLVDVMSSTMPLALTLGLGQWLFRFILSAMLGRTVIERDV